MSPGHSVHLFSIFLLSLSLILLTADGTRAQDNALGSQIFRSSCAACHGTDGKGGGEFAKILTVKPPNLTLLSANNHGVFPYLDVFQFIDGRTIVGAHGKRDMPIWGDVFKQDIGESVGPYGHELLIRARMMAVVDYVASLQEQ